MSGNGRQALNTRPITERQRQVLVMLLEVPQPSYRDMARRMGISLSSLKAIHDHVVALERKDVIRRGHTEGTKRSRAIAVLQPWLAIGEAPPEWPRRLLTSNGELLQRVWP